MQDTQATEHKAKATAEIQRREEYEPTAGGTRYGAHQRLWITVKLLCSDVHMGVQKGEVVDFGVVSRPPPTALFAP